MPGINSAKDEVTISGMSGGAKLGHIKVSQDTNGEVVGSEIERLESNVIDRVLKIIKKLYYSYQEIGEIEKILENKDFVESLLREHSLKITDFEILQGIFIESREGSHVFIQIENEYGINDFYINMTDLNKYLSLYNK